MLNSTVIHKVASMHEQVGNVSRKMGILRKNKKKGQILKAIKNAFDGLVSNLSMYEKIIYELGDILIYSSKNKMLRRTKTKSKDQNIQ